MEPQSESDPSIDSAPTSGVDPSKVYRPNTANPVDQPPLASSNIIKITPLKPRFSRKLIIIAAVALVFIGASAAAYLGYYLPNKPENIWSRALVNTGKGYDMVSSYIASRKNIKGTKLDGSFKLSGLMAADGTFSGTSDDKNGHFTGSLAASGLKVNLDVRTITENSNTPDIYFKVDGIQELGTLIGGEDSSTTQALNGLNGQWYFIDHTFFDQFAQGANTNQQLTSEDINSVLRAIGDASKKYVFTGDEKKRAIALNKVVGKEKQEGRNVYHYKVGINKQNLKAYLKELCNGLKSSKLNKFFDNSGEDFERATGCINSARAVDNIDSSRLADAWVDLKTKLIYKVRFNQKDKPDNFVEIYQKYSGGDVLPIGLGYQSKDNDVTSHGKLELSLNMKTNELNINGSADSSGENGLKGSFNMKILPNNSPVKVDKPANPKSIIQLLNDIGFMDVGESGVADTERKNDINALHVQLEAYQAQHGFYPTLANLNDPSWRSKNLDGLDAETLKDPQGSSARLFDTPAARFYSYEAFPLGCNNLKTSCSSYTLTATLESGGNYIKTALNGFET